MKVPLTNLKVFFIGSGWGKTDHLVRWPQWPWYKPWVIDECGTVGGMTTGTGNLSKRKKSAPM
jgi:hypothetical protein